MSATSTRGMRLSQLLGGLAAVAPGDDCMVSDLTLDSRAVTPGSCFVAVAGTGAHGLDYLDQAAAAGAAVVIADRPVARPSASLPVVVVPALKAHLGEIASRFFAAPSADVAVYAVTGTNGKTTVCWLVADMLRRLDGSCAYIGTLGAGTGAPLDALENTTPDVITINRYLARFRARGVTACALEASSHALDQERLAGIGIAAAAFTNLGFDHGDYHGSRAAYAHAKERLFRQRPLGAAVFNIDDAEGRRMAAALEDGVALWTCSAHGFERAYVRATDVRGSAEATCFTLHVGDSARGLRLPLIGHFNLENALLAATMLLASGYDLDRVCAALEQVSAPPGRMQHCGTTAAGAVVFVDYAHTPDSLAAALRALRALAPRQLWVVFGCGGNRDRDKRPRMGQVASALADRVVVTSDNPRDEDAAAIADAIIAGISDAACVTVELDRARAIRRAVGGAGDGDLVLVAGKGHEAWQQVRDERIPFDDRLEVGAALEATGT